MLERIKQKYSRRKTCLKTLQVLAWYGLTSVLLELSVSIVHGVTWLFGQEVDPRDYVDMDAPLGQDDPSPLVMFAAVVAFAAIAYGAYRITGHLAAVVKRRKRVSK